MEPQAAFDKSEMFTMIANYIASERIPSCVLHGIDPGTGDIGRDLDLYVPDLHQAYKVALHFSMLLREQGVRWVSLMHPIWGPRCIGIRESDLCYWELHIATRMKTARIDFADLIPIAGREGAYGFNFNPSFWFIKQVLQKYLKDFLCGRKVWTSHACDPYMLASKDEIGEQFQKIWSHGEAFVLAALGPDTDANLCTRQEGTLSLMARYYLNHPLNAPRAVGRWLYRKGYMYKSPTVPVFGIDTAIDSSTLQRYLAERLRHVFTRVVVADLPVKWRTRCFMQATQSLLILRHAKGHKKDYPVDSWISVPSVDQIDLEICVAEILDNIVRYNGNNVGLYETMSMSET